MSAAAEGHADLEMTGEYAFVAPERQNELTRRIQECLAAAGTNKETERTEPGPAPVPPTPRTPEVPPGLADAVPITPLVQ